jgi:hemerythrin-like metal-binding protein
MLEWNEQYETGDALIDAQHRMLISYVGRLEALAQTVNPTPEDVHLFVRSIEFLETYALTHFQQEENCMRRARCPAHRDNLQAHSEFLDFLNQFKRQVELEGWRSDLVRELHTSCTAWVVRHILRIDTWLKYSPPPDANAGSP